MSHLKNLTWTSVIAGLALLLAAISLFACVELVQQVQNQRAESIRLLCDLTGTMRFFVRQPPDYPRDPPTLYRLRQERCDKLLKDIGPPKPTTSTKPPKPIHTHTHTSRQ